MKVKHTNERTWIEGVEGFSPGEYASSVHGSQARILQTLGESLSYEDLICYGGFAFRVAMHEAFCPSAGHPCCGFMCIDGSNRALPWNTKFYGSLSGSKQKADRTAFEAEVRAAVKASIDRGVPVHYGSEEDGLIIGYGNNGQRWWCVHPYHEGGKKAFWHDEGKGFAGGKWPWGIMVWTGPKRDEECVSKRNLTLAALRQAVEMWNTEKQQAYFCGEAAYAHWLRWLGDVEAGKVADPASGLPGNSWCYAVLIHSRRIAGRWLNQAAGDFTGESASQLRIAAEHYAQIAEVCMKDLKSPWDLTPGIDHWTSQLRQQQIARLEAAREHDRAAVDGLTTALETLK